MTDMRRRISSNWTVVPKILTPLLAAGMFLVGVWAILYREPREGVVICLAFGLVGIFAIRFARKLCFASADDFSLYLRGLGRSAAVPRSAIAAVDWVPGSRWPLVRISIAAPTELGTEAHVILPLGTAGQDAFAFLTAGRRTDRGSGAPAPGSAPSTRLRLAAALGLLAVLVVLALEYLRS
jgi:hypothetical protein